MLRSTSTRPHRLSYLFKHLYRRSSLLRRITSTNDYSTCTTTTDISKSSSNAKNANQDIDSTLTSKDILFLSPTLWPQPDASAAGVRTSSLLQHFSSTSKSASHNQFNNVHFGCGLKEQPNPNIGISFPRVQLHHLPPNRLDRIQKFVKENVKGELKAVVFDRFFAEEAYSFQFHKHGETANVLRILDMQDMHSLRYHRQNLIREIDSASCSEKRSGIEFGHGLDHFKDDTFMNSFPMVAQGTSMSSSQSQSRQSYGKDKNAHLTLLRELASIHRSDLTLVCSQFELDLLTDEYGINPDKLVLAPFFTKEVDYSYCDSNEHEMQTETERETETLLSQSYERRKDFIALGGFKHLPNVDQVLMLKHHLWPQIRKQIPDAKLHIYGSYPPQRIQQLHDVKNGFIVHGYVDDLDLPLGGSRVLLAPLRYGAGVKGKIVDAWRFGCPVVTTPIGSEGIGNTNRNGDGNGNGIDKDHHDTTLTKDWGGIVAYNNDDFIKGAIELYSNKDEWIRAQLNSRRLSKELFDATSNLAVVDDAIALAMETMHSRRQRDYTSAMLWQDSARSTEYFSRWIELKESLSS